MLALLAVINVADVLLVRQWEIVPFHLVWASLAVLYGFRVWTVRRTAYLLIGVILVTGLPLLYSVTRGLEPVTELSEVPLISGIFLAMIWHARRYQFAIAQQGRLAETQRVFVRDASHELRTPITVASGYAELILTSSDRIAAKDAAVVLDELERLARLAENLLLLAASGHSGFLRPRPTELAPFLQGVVDRWQATAARDWQIEIAANSVVPLDCDRIAVAVDALIENAVSFTSRGDRIVVALATRGGRALINVSDSGPGIHPDVQDRIFEPFARADRARNRATGGTGLGLAIAKAIVEAHDGCIALRSTQQGASFEIALPGS